MIADKSDNPAATLFNPPLGKANKFHIIILQPFWVTLAQRFAVYFIIIAGLTAIGQYTGNVQKSLTNDIDKLSAAINRYRELWPVFRESLREYLLDLKAQGHRIAVYGTGARSSTVVNFSEIGHLIEFFVDDQEEKQGLWVPGCKLSIRPGHSLYEERITFCLLGVNKENESKVMEKHKEWTKNGGIFRSILPPSDMLINSWPFDRFIGT